MQGTEAYIGSEQELDARICQKETREMKDVLSRCLLSFSLEACRQRGNAINADDVEETLLSAYKHLDQFKRSAQMSTCLTAIAVVIHGCDCADESAGA
jgi:DNA-directed RNA polymerase specialized sigma24 family protein